MYADRNAEELIGRDDSKGKIEEQKQEAKERPADKISTTTVAKNTDVSAEETDVSRPWPDLSSENSSEREVSMKDWKTYRSEKLGIVFKYPGSWIVKENINNSTKSVYLKNASGSIGVTVNLPLREIGYEFWKTDKEEEVFLDQVVATKRFMVSTKEKQILYGLDKIPDNLIIVQWNFDDYINSGEIVLNYSYQGYSNAELIFDQILKSFKFLDEQQSSTSDWQLYQNDNLGVSFKYPDGWKITEFVNGIGVGPKEIRSDALWGVFYYTQSQKTQEDLVREIGKQFGGNRKEIIEDIVIDGIQGVKVVVTSPTISDWYSESVVIQHKGKIFRIGNGAVKNDEFKKFYNSFKFAKE